MALLSCYDLIEQEQKIEFETAYEMLKMLIGAVNPAYAKVLNDSEEDEIDEENIEWQSGMESWEECMASLEKTKGDLKNMLSKDKLDEWF